MTLAAGSALGTAAGTVLGLAYFGGLLWTVRRLPRSSRPWLLAGLSFLVRTVVVVGVLVVLARTGSVVALATSLLGFLGARIVLTRAVAARPAPAGGARTWT